MANIETNRSILEQNIERPLGEQSGQTSKEEMPKPQSPQRLHDGRKDFFAYFCFCFATFAVQTLFVARTDRGRNRASLGLALQKLSPQTAGGTYSLGGAA